MQIQCPKCKEWIESDDGICPLCSANIEQAQNAVDLPKSFYIKMIIKRIVLLVLVVLGIIGVVFYILYLTEPEERHVDVIGPLSETIDGCLPPYDAVAVPEGADDETILKMEQELYLAHLEHTDCRTPDGKPDSTWASRIGSGWLSKVNEQIMAQNPRYQNVLTREGVGRYDQYRYDNSFMNDYEGCHGFPISTAYDGMRLYMRSPKKGEIELAFTNNSTQLEHEDYSHSLVMERMENLGDARYTVHTPDIPVRIVQRSVIVSLFEEIPYLSGHVVEPVHRSPVLYGIDEDHYTEGVLKQIKNTPYYSFYSGGALYMKMKKGDVFRVVFLVKYFNQSIILYRVYPLSHDIPTDAQFFDDACRF